MARGAEQLLLVLGRLVLVALSVKVMTAAHLSRRQRGPALEVQVEGI
jgi:hypothetical protein